MAWFGRLEKTWGASTYDILLRSIIRGAWGRTKILRKVTWVSGVGGANLAKTHLAHGPNFNKKNIECIIKNSFFIQRQQKTKPSKHIG